MREFKGKVAVVTGAGSGVGSGICAALARRGAAVVAADIDAEAAERTAAGIAGDGGRAIAVATDVCSRTSVEALARRAESELGGVDIVCNNAGVLVGGPMQEISEDDWQWLWSVNVMGVVHGCHVFAPMLIERGGGHIVNTASVGGFLSFSTLATYCTTKFAVIGFSEALQMELAERGVGVSILCPGKVHSNLDNADRLRPERFADAGGTSKELGDLGDGMDPLEVGEHVARGIETEAPYIFTHPEFKALIEERFNKVLDSFPS